jgi:hypothetical protein
MRSIPVALGTLALLTACTGTPTTTPTAPAGTNGSQQSPAPGQSVAPATALNASSTLTMDSKAITAFDAVPLVTYTGGGVVTVVNPSQRADRGYSVNITFKSIKAGNKGLSADFKAEDIDRLEIKIEQFIADRYAGNAWTGTFDVPSTSATTTLKREGDRLAGTIVATLQPDGKNETDMKKPISFNYAFENAIKK